MRALIFPAMAGAALAGVVGTNAAENAATMRQTGYNPNRIVCAYLYHEGTVIGRPVCKTAQAWENDRERSRRAIREFQLRALDFRH